MDKMTLTKEQLSKLKRYIKSRGFREPLIVMEILDHFACKVEEVLVANPKLGLQEAMILAHDSFGVSGFKKLADAADIERNRNYNKIFKSQVHILVTNPIIWISCAAASVGYYKFCEWFLTESKIEMGGFGLFFITVLIAFASNIGAIPSNSNNRYVSGYGKFADNGYSWLMFMALSTFPVYRESAPVWIFALYTTIVTLLVILRGIVMYKTKLQVQSGERAIERMYTEL